MDGLQYSINFTGNAVQVLQHVNEALGGTILASNKATSSLGDTWKKLMAFNQITESIDRVKNSLDGMNVPGISLNKNMQELSAITGVTGAGLIEISDSARASAKAFGTDATQNVESYKILLSKLSPDIAKSTEALSSMGKSVNILSKSMGGDTVASVGVLTTAMNQYGVSTEDPIAASKVMTEYMNIMASAAQKGSAELPQIGQALETVGLTAKTVGLSFAETNAAIQVLDKAGAKGAEGGTALRNVLLGINGTSTASQGVFKQYGINLKTLQDPTVLLSDKLKLLQPIMGNVTAMAKVFGEPYIGAGKAMLQGSNEIVRLTDGIQNNNSAVDQANIVMESYEERQKRAKAKIDDIKISFFNATESIQPFISSTLNAAGEIGKLGAGLNALSTLFINDFTKGIFSAITGLFKKTVATNADTLATGANATATTASSAATSGYTGVMRIFNTVMAANPLGLFLRGLLLVGTALAVGAGLFSAYNSNQNRAAELTADLAAKVSVEKAQLNNLFEQLKRTNPESQKRKELIEELNKKYPELLKNQNLEKMNEAELEVARKGANDELERTIYLVAVREAKEKAYKEKVEKDMSMQKVLFKTGLSEDEINNLKSGIDSEASNIVSTGKYDAGFFSGASNSQIDDVVDKAIKGNYTLINKLTKGDKYQKAAIAQVIREYADASLTSGNEIKDLDKLSSSKGLNTNAASPTPAATETAKITGKEIAKGVVETAKKEKAVKGSGNTGGGSSSMGGKTIHSLVINKLVENLTIHTTNIGDTKEKIRQHVTEALLTSVNDFNLSAN